MSKGEVKPLTPPPPCPPEQETAEGACSAATCSAYQIVMHELPSVFEKTVNHLIAQGWEPIGGVTVCPFASGQGHQFVQAMILPNDQEELPNQK